MGPLFSLAYRYCRWAGHLPRPSKAIPTLTFPRWTWAGVNLTACCGPKGFKSDKKGCKCKVQHKKDAAECGPSPYYTNR